MKTNEKLIEQLANKLGTTADYLWHLLLRQAPISATIELIQIVLLIVGGIILFKMHWRFMNNDNKISYYNSEGALIFPMAIAAGFWLVFMCLSCSNFNNIINGYFNPEFWALDYIFHSLSKK